MQQKFIIENEEIIGVEKERTIAQEEFNYNGCLSVLITDEGEYYNIYVIDEMFKKEPMNCLKLQEPKVDLKLKNEEEYFNKMRLEMWAIEHYLWTKYSTYEKVLSFGVEVYET